VSVTGGEVEVKWWAGDEHAQTKEHARARAPLVRPRKRARADTGSSSFLLLELVLDLFRLQFLEGIFCYPPSCFGVHVLDLIGAFQGYCTKVVIPLLYPMPDVSGLHKSG